MKRSLLSKIAVILTLCVLGTALLPSCSTKRKVEEASDLGGLESGSVEVNTQLSSEEKTEGAPIQKPQETTAQKEQTTVAEQTESETETKKPAVAETEKKPTEPVEPQSSLLFLSFGNGTCSVAGIGTYSEQSLIIPAKSPSGDVVTAIEPRAFYENTDIRTVQIPSTVTSIGEMAFSGCSSLVYIVVDGTNRCYRDVNGVLYSADRTVLIAYPAANQATTLELSPKITAIADMALYGCSNLKTIVFSGSPEDWERLDIGSLNYSLFSASVIFTDADK